MARKISEVLGSLLRRVTSTKAPQRRPRTTRPAEPKPPKPSSSGKRSPSKPSSSKSSSGTPRPKPASSDARLAGVSIEYNPSLDGDADPGEVVWTWVPYEEDASQGKDRPVVIVGRRGRMLVGVPLTSKPHDNERQVPVGTGPWDREGRPSYAKLDLILDVDASKVRREGSILDRRHFDQIVAALRD